MDQICNLLLRLSDTVARPVQQFTSVLSINTPPSPLLFIFHPPSPVPPLHCSFVSPLPFIIALKQSSLIIVFVNGTVNKNVVSSRIHSTPEGRLTHQSSRWEAGVSRWLNCLKTMGEKKKVRNNCTRCLMWHVLMCKCASEVKSTEVHENK